MTQVEWRISFLFRRDLTKYYGKFLAVDKLNLGVQRGECFGLLGVNRAFLGLDTCAAFGQDFCSRCGEREPSATIRVVRGALWLRRCFANVVIFVVMLVWFGHVGFIEVKVVCRSDIAGR